jgi:hypothetical protein
MATDAIVVTNSELVHVQGAAMTPLVQLLPMTPGRSYVVWASGTLHIENAHVTVELEAFGAQDSVQLGAVNHHVPYALAVGTTLPPDEDLFTGAKVSAAIDSEADPSLPSRAATINGRLVVLAVDSVTVQGT